MIPLISRRGFQRAHALLDQPAVLAVGRDDPALAALANDQARTGVDGPQIVDFERLSLSGDRRRIALDPGDRPPVAVVDYRYVAGVRCDGGKHIIRSEEHTSELQSLMRNSYAVFSLKKKKYNTISQTEKQ